MSAVRKSIGRYLIVGLTGTVLHYIILRTCLWLTIGMTVANLVGFLGSFFFTYLGNRFFVFEGKSSHFKAFGVMITGYIGFALFHTMGMVSFTNGAVFRFFDITIARFGGSLLSTFWEWLATTLPSSLAQLIFTTPDPGKLTTSFTFLMVTGMTTIMSYCWNRFVVFQLRQTPALEMPQNASANNSVQ